MNRIATSIEQSKKLVELGIDPSTADMSYRPYREEGGISDYELDLCPYKYASWIGYPAWSLSALLKLLPKIENIPPALIQGNVTNDWYVWYEDKYDTQTHNNPIDAVVEAIEHIFERDV